MNVFIRSNCITNVYIWILEIEISIPIVDLFTFLSYFVVYYPVSTFGILYMYCLV